MFLESARQLHGSDAGSRNVHVDGSASRAQIPSSVADTLMAAEITSTIQTQVAGLHRDVNWGVKGQKTAPITR